MCSSIVTVFFFFLLCFGLGLVKVFDVALSVVVGTADNVDSVVVAIVVDVVVAVVDLDNFKSINDRFGHATGDQVIQHVAETLVEHVRQSDIVGRLGGDEFGIALTHADLADGQSKAARLESIISAVNVRDAGNEALGSVRLGASCGTVLWRPGRDAASLIAEADETMFRRKNERKRAR